MPTKSFDDFLFKELKDRELAAGYLSASLEGGSMEEFLLALRHVAQVHGGLGDLSKKTDLNRQSIYKMLSEDGNPTLASLIGVLHALGFELAFKPRTDRAA
ncbi:MAG: addiction module antidote protein [Acidobacteriota bacterium]